MTRSTEYNPTFAFANSSVGTPVKSTIALFSALFVLATASAVNFSGIPHYRFYTEKDIHSADRSLFITQAPDNTIIFGTEKAVIQFDGTSWNHIHSSENTESKITSIYFDEGKVYAGAYQEAGVLVFDDNSKLELRAFNETPFGDEPSDYFTDIVPWGDDRIVYLGTRSVAILNKVDQTVTHYSLNRWTKSAFVSDDQLHIGTNDGVFLLSSRGTFEEAPLLEDFRLSSTIEATERLSNGDILLGTTNDGIFIIRGNQVFPSNYTDVLNYKEFSLSDIQLMPDGKIAVVIFGKGIFLYNPDGSLAQRLDSSIDFRFKSARKVTLDQNYTLWAMLNSAVAKVILDTSLTEIDERLRPSLHYGKLFYIEDQLLLRNDNRLVTPTFDDRMRITGFEPASSEGEINAISATEAPDGLYIRSRNSISLFRGGKLIDLVSAPTVDAMVVPHGKPNLLVTVSPKHISLLKRKNDSLTILSQTPNPSGFPYRIISDEKGNLWIENGIARVTRIWIQDNAIFAKAYGKEEGTPSGWVTLWLHEGEMKFAQAQTILRYNAATDSFVDDSILDPYFPIEDRVVNRAATDPSGSIWISANNANYILWPQPDGTYQVDGSSLSAMGQLYFNVSLFPTEKDAFLMTSNQLFHFDKEAGARLDPGSQPETRIISIRNRDRGNIFFHSLQNSKVSPLELDHGFNDLTFRISNTYSRVLTTPQYRFKLDGFSKEWSEWLNSNELNFTNLDFGSYTLNVETRLGDGTIVEPLSYSFAIDPAFYQTRWAILAYMCAAIGLVMLIAQLTSRQLKYQNLKLEHMVSERTQEIECKNQELASTLNQLQSTQEKLLVTARRAGMAEVATNVLHNVGNVLNSINIGVSDLSRKLSQSRISKLQKIADLIHENRERLPQFISDDPKGRAIPDYIEQLSKVMSQEFESFVREITGVRTNIEHVNRIIATQQEHAKTVDVIQPIDLKELVEAAITIIVGGAEQTVYHVELDFEPDLVIESDKHKVLQMLTNFIKNAMEAISEYGEECGQITISGKFDSPKQTATIEIEDNGIGIEADHLSKIFNHGFTTKPNGHGFGMHSCANTVKSLGGEVRIESRGRGQGAKVVMKLPRSAPKHCDEEVKECSNHGVLI